MKSSHDDFVPESSSVAKECATHHLNSDCEWVSFKRREKHIWWLAEIKPVEEEIILSRGGEILETAENVFEHLQLLRPSSYLLTMRMPEISSTLRCRCPRRSHVERRSIVPFFRMKVLFHSRSTKAANQRPPK